MNLPTLGYTNKGHFKSEIRWKYCLEVTTTVSYSIVYLTYDSPSLGLLVVFVHVYVCVCVLVTMCMFVKFALG